MQRRITFLLSLLTVLSVVLLPQVLGAGSNVVYLPLVMNGISAPAPVPTNTTIPIPTNTASPAPTNTVPPLPTWTPVPTSTPGPTTLPSEVKILSSSAYIDSIDNLWIVGEVQNNTSQNVEFVKTVASLYDGDTFIGTDFGYTSLDILRPGQKSPFKIVVSDPPLGYDSYRLQVDWDTTTDRPLDGITILSHRSRSASIPGWRYIEGEVRNDSGGPVEFVKIVATMYNASGTVVEVDFTYTSIDELAPGQTSPFEIIVTRWNNVARYELQVQARRP